MLDGLQFLTYYPLQNGSLTWPIIFSRDPSVARVEMDSWFLMSVCMCDWEWESECVF